jgi:DNA mismatch endonuclease (patch repair protein)
VKAPGRSRKATGGARKRTSTTGRADDARTRLMKSVRREHTAPEVAVRRHLHARGLRYALHRRDLPGRPDIVLPARRSVVFVHGCFWHGHACSHGAVQAKTNAAFWSTKIADNRARDRRKAAALRRLGWRVETIWECQVRDRRRLDRLCAVLLAR